MLALCVNVCVCVRWHRGTDVCLGLPQLLSEPLSKCRHGVFGGAVEMLVGARYHPVSSHTV